MKWLKRFKVLFAKVNEWQDGNPPPSWPRSWIEEGVRLDPSDPKKVITCWRKSAAYYKNLI